MAPIAQGVKVQVRTHFATHFVFNVWLNLMFGQGVWQTFWKAQVKRCRWFTMTRYRIHVTGEATPRTSWAATVEDAQRGAKEEELEPGSYVILEETGEAGTGRIIETG